MCIRDRVMSHVGVELTAPCKNDATASAGSMFRMLPLVLYHAGVEPTAPCKIGASASSGTLVRLLAFTVRGTSPWLC
eukprot:11150849-Heterocapsa_arctica.AAC.1